MELYLSVIGIGLSCIAVFISIKAYKITIPAIKIQLLNTPFYGGTEIKNNNITNFMACCHLRINNRSGQKVSLSEIYLLVDGEKFALADKDIDVHKEKEFYFEDLLHLTEDKYITDGTCIMYQEDGLFNNIIIDAFSSVDKFALFSFPRQDKSKVKCFIVFETPYKTIKKRMVLLLYDENYDNEEFEEIERWKKTL